jgi:hypothetical protein
MNLNLIATPGPAKTILNANIEQRIQIKHVPLKYNTETEDVTIVSVLEDPILSISQLSVDGSDIESLIKDYEATLESLDNAIAIYKSKDVVEDLEKVVSHLFHTLALDDDNYKTKTGEPSLWETVVKTTAQYEAFAISANVDANRSKLNEYNLEKAWELYNKALEKAVNL